MIISELFEDRSGWSPERLAEVGKFWHKKSNSVRNDPELSEAAKKVLLEEYFWAELWGITEEEYNWAREKFHKDLLFVQFLVSSGKSP